MPRIVIIGGLDTIPKQVDYQTALFGCQIVTKDLATSPEVSQLLWSYMIVVIEKFVNFKIPFMLLSGNLPDRGVSMVSLWL